MVTGRRAKAAVFSNGSKNEIFAIKRQIMVGREESSEVSEVREKSLVKNEKEKFLFKKKLSCEEHTQIADFLSFV